MVLSRSAHQPSGRSERPALRLVLAVAALVSFSLAGVTISDGFHPMALVASLLPLQLAALLWVLRR